MYFVSECTLRKYCCGIVEVHQFGQHFAYIVNIDNDAKENSKSERFELSLLTFISEYFVPFTFDEHYRNSE